MINSIEDKVQQLIEKPVNKLGYDLYDVEYTKEGKNFFLRIYIDNATGIDLNDCEKVNNEISDLLDTADYIKEQYFLEVSSTGIEKTLRKEKHFQDNIGQKIELKLYKPINGAKQIIGTLQEFNKEVIKVKSDDTILEVSRKDISLIKTVYDWK